MVRAAVRLHFKCGHHFNAREWRHQHNALLPEGASSESLGQYTDASRRRPRVISFMSPAHRPFVCGLQTKIKYVARKTKPEARSKRTAALATQEA
jgi:hypothetical protein